MKFGIAARLSWILALSSGLIAGLTGLYAYRASHDLLVQSATGELLGTTRMLAERIRTTRQEVSRLLQVLAGHPASLAMLRDGHEPDAQQLATLFELLMQQNPGFMQIRLIAGADHGQERVRVDRDGTQLLRVTGADLQEKGHYPYVADTLALPPGSTYLSRIVINHERGSHTGLGQPTAMLAAPVADAHGQVRGLIVINIDLNGIFAGLATNLQPHFQLFMANASGDWLLHPEPGRAFGFDRGQRVLMQDEFAGTQALIDGRVQHLVLQARSGRYAHAPLVAAFVAQQVLVPSEEVQLVFGVAQPLDKVLERADRLGHTILQIVAGFGLAGVLLAVLLARFITRPLGALNRSVQQFAAGQPGATALPLQRQDELGDLARSVQQMQQQINQQFEQLQRQSTELEHLARHDVLTGLPNRRLFMERLHSAIDLASRHDGRLALMFIDLNNFKAINDDLGHDAGDAALRAVAQRLQRSTRKVDTVARLGGDEFVLLLDSPVQREQAAAIAQKLIDTMAEPVIFGTQPLTVGLSIGISLYPQDGSSSDPLITAADSAMYQAKLSRPSAYCFADGLTAT